jgi:hypothetical protein
LPLHDSSDHRDSPESAEPTLRKDPLEAREANDPMDPSDSTEPTLPMDRIEYADPTDRIDPSERIDRIDRDERRLRKLELHELSTVAMPPVYHRLLAGKPARRNECVPSRARATTYRAA